MLYEFLLTLFIIASLILVLVIMIQQGKGSMGMGSLGGGTQMLFGGSGGQDLFQKTTWVLGALFMIGSFALTLMRAKEGETSRYLTSEKAAVVRKAAPVATPAAAEKAPAN